MKKILLLVIFALLVPQVSGAYLSGDIYINELGTSRFNIDTDRPFNIKELNYKNQKQIGRTEILTSKSGANWQFNLNLSDYDSILLDINLPNSLTTISEISGPKNIIDFKEKTVSVIAPSNESLIITYQIKETKNLAWIGWIIFIILLIIPFQIIMKIKKRKNKLNTIMSLIREVEQKIVDSLMSGPIRQKELRKKLNILKASYSRYLVNLEKKKLIIREGAGKNKVLRLK